MCCGPCGLSYLQGIPTLPELKLRYYELMITYHQHYHNYLEICRCYKAIYESDGVQADPALWQPVGGLTTSCCCPAIMQASFFLFTSSAE